MQLTEHFADTELRVAGADAQIVANATALCAAILEPIRAKFGPVTITSGYRSPTGNEAAGGVTNSQHLYEGGNAAADIRVQPMVIIFDWITQQSELPFDQAILEPIRAKFGPVTITSGYRSPTGNEAAGGVTNSQHLYEGGNAAADIRVQPMVIIFDWITQQSELPFDQAILETDETDTPRCIHLSYVNGGTQRREALTGGVNGTKPYLPAPVS